MWCSGIGVNPRVDCRPPWEIKKARENEARGLTGPPSQDSQAKIPGYTGFVRGMERFSGYSYGESVRRASRDPFGTQAAQEGVPCIHNSQAQFQASLPNDKNTGPALPHALPQQRLRLRRSCTLVYSQPCSLCPLRLAGYCGHLPGRMNVIGTQPNTSPKRPKTPFTSTFMAAGKDLTGSSSPILTIIRPEGNLLTNPKPDPMLARLHQDPVARPSAVIDNKQYKMPGYTGYLRGRENRLGQTQGVISNSLSEADFYTDSGITFQGDKIRPTTLSERFIDQPVAGYTGHLAGGKESDYGVGKSFGSIFNTKMEQKAELGGVLVGPPDPTKHWNTQDYWDNRLR